MRVFKEESSIAEKPDGPCEFSLAIVTHNRKEELRRTLQRTLEWFPTASNEILVYDDASIDGTYAELSEEFPQVKWFSGRTQVGGSVARRLLYSHVKGQFILGLDDDAEFVSTDVCEIVAPYFEAEKQCGALAFRIFWGKELPAPPAKLLLHSEPPFVCRDFAACGYAIRTRTYKNSKGYPYWMTNIYGEESYLSLGVYQAGWEIHYLPSVLVHHRVDIEKRKQDRNRARFWFRNQLANQLGIALTNYPLKLIPAFYTKLLWHNLWKYAVGSHMIAPYMAGVFQFIRMLPVLMRNRMPLTYEQFHSWLSYPSPVYFYQPTDKGKRLANTLRRT